MALSISQTKALGEILKPGMRVASMGYPDIIAPMDIIWEMLSNKGPLHFRLDSEAICKRHNLSSRKIPDAGSFFGLLGCKLDVYDIVQERGCEILCDLNVPLEQFRPLSADERANIIGDPVPREELDTWLMSSAKTYDVVLDVGTLEHCFNVGQAAFTMASLVKKDGYILHENPHSGWSNHGFYSLHPTWYADFYRQNGFTLLDCRLIPRNGYPAFSPPLTARFVFSAQEANIFAVARRDEIRKLVYPTQTKYKPAAGGLSGDAAAER